MNTTPTPRQMVIGYAELSIAQICVGLNIVTGKVLIAYMPIFLLLTLRFLIGLVATAGLTYLGGGSVTHAFKRFFALTTKDKILLIFQAACGGFLFNVFILHGMQSTSATSAGIITSFTPMMIFVLAAIILREQLTAQRSLAIIISIIGLIVLNTGKAVGASTGTLIGNFLVFIAIVPEALFTILSKSIGNKMSQLEAVTLVNFFNLLMFIPLTGIGLKNFSWEHMGIGTYSLILMYGISGGIMFFLFWYRGLTKINANVAALFTGLMPISTTFLAWLALHEPIYKNDFIGMSLVIVAIFVGCYRFPASRKRFI